MISRAYVTKRDPFSSLRCFLPAFVHPLCDDDIIIIDSGERNGAEPRSGIALGSVINRVHSARLLLARGLKSPRISPATR